MWTRRIIRFALPLVAMAAAPACGGASPTAPAVVDPLAGFTITGDPASTTGASWTYRARFSGVDFDLQGILLRPSDPGTYPAVIISHGAGGNASGYSRAIARVMVGWGLVCIATSYTHAGGAPAGLPSGEAGASTANVQRARVLVEILRGLGYVDLNRVALHGHSMGAFVTAAVAGAHPDLFRAASHTAGGMAPDVVAGVAPKESQIADIRAPYQMHHGDRDVVVPLAADQLFASALRARGVTHELVVYPGADHDDVSMNPVVLDRIRAWYRANGIF